MRFPKGRDLQAGGRTRNLRRQEDRSQDAGRRGEGVDPVSGEHTCPRYRAEAGGADDRVGGGGLGDSTSGGEQGSEDHVALQGSMPPELVWWPDRPEEG